MELRRVEHGGYPAEFLQARVMGRRGYLIADWDHLLAAPSPLEAVPATPYREALTEKSEEKVWKNLLREYHWAYRHMEPGLRRIFAPFFLYFELRTLVLCLRSMKEKNAGKIEELLLFSLLAERVKTVLHRETDISPAVDGVTAIFAISEVRFGRLRKIYSEYGLKGYERELSNLFLAHVADTRIHPLIGEFFRRRTDAVNIITLYKHLRWRIKAPLSFVRGGRIGEAMLRDILGKGEISGIGPLLQPAGGREADLAAAGRVEHLLLTRLSELLRRQSTEPEGIGLILDYLWRCYLEAHNLSILLHCGDMDYATVRAELIR